VIRVCCERPLNADILIIRVFVNGRPRPVIFEDMQSRIRRGAITLERREAIKVCSFKVKFSFRVAKALKAMCDIAADRATKLSQQNS